MKKKLVAINSSFISTISQRLTHPYYSQLSKINTKSASISRLKAQITEVSEKIEKSNYLFPFICFFRKIALTYSEAIYS